jgi:hypothetical protein
MATGIRTATSIHKYNKEEDKKYDEGHLRIFGESKFEKRLREELEKEKKT